MLWDLKGIKIFLDISTYCNAGCPQCHRTNPEGLGKADWLPLVQWDLKTFQKAFPPQELENIDKFHFCGTWGDPVMCKELDQVLKYVVDNSSETKMSISTNGSIRDENWWWDIGVACGNRLHVIFAIDGSTQEMHEQYRRFTNLEKILENMNMLSQTQAIVHSQTVVFKHNENHLDEIKELVKKNGSTTHTHVLSDRFGWGYPGDLNTFTFTNEKNEPDQLERSSPDALKGDAMLYGDKIDMSEEISCRWAKPRNEVLVNPDGQLLPCCYHGNNHYEKRIDKTKETDMFRHTLYADDYNENLKKYNVLHTPLSEILSSEWYQKKLPESMTSDNPIKQCLRQCTTRTKKIWQTREKRDI